MEQRSRRLFADTVLLLGLALFAVGAVALLLDYPLPVETSVIGALALLFVGVGTRLGRRGRVPPT